MPFSGVSYLLVCSRGGLVLIERVFPSREPEASAAALAWRAAAHALTAPCLPSAREQEEHVATHECASGRSR